MATNIANMTNIKLQKLAKAGSQSPQNWNRVSNVANRYAWMGWLAISSSVSDGVKIGLSMVKWETHHHHR